MTRPGIRERARVKKHRRGSASFHVGGACLVSGPLGRKHLRRWHVYANLWADHQQEAARDWQERHHLWGTDNSESHGGALDGHSTKCPAVVT